MSKESTLPEAKQWNNYWSLDQTKKFTKVSWSKIRIMRMLDPYIKEGGRALDAGCGSGFFCKYFLDKGMRATALDYSEEALALAKQQTDGKVEVVCKDLVNDELVSAFDQPFDIIFSDGLLEHFIESDQNKIIQNLRSVLSDDGVLVTFVPNRWSPWELIRPFYMPGIEEDPFVLSQLVALHRTNQFKIVGQGGINTFPFIFSPDRLVGSLWGMLLYTIAKKE